MGHHGAAVGACFALLVVDEPRAEALRTSVWRAPGRRGGTYAVAVRVSAGYGVGLVEQAVADLAGEVCAQAVEVGAQHVQLLGRISRRILCPIVNVCEKLTSSALLGRDGSSGSLAAIFWRRLSLLGARPGRPSAGWAGERLGGVPRSLEPDGPASVDELLAACCEAMDDDEFLGRAAASGGEGGRVWFMAGGGGETTQPGRPRAVSTD